jgi:hypothetical protein
MAYNKRNNMQRIIDIQNITLENQQRGVTKKWIFENLIEPVYHISERTYSKYLGINAKRLIKALKND